jgi:hypothetical protein
MITPVQTAFHVVGAAVELNQRLPVAVSLRIGQALALTLQKEMIGQGGFVSLHQGLYGRQAGAAVVQFARPLKKA